MLSLSYCLSCPRPTHMVGSGGDGDGGHQSVLKIENHRVPIYNSQIEKASDANAQSSM